MKLYAHSNLPFSWTWVKLGDVSRKIHYGFTASAIQEDVGPKLLRITDIQNGCVNWEKVPFCHIEEDDINKYLLQENDIVFARTGATVGKSFLIRGKIPRSVFASYLIRLQLSDKTLPKFIYLFFQTNDYWSQIKSSSAGIGQPNVNAQKLSNLILPLPPLPEQKKIVEKIEELFSGLDSGVTSLKKAKEQLRIYRQSVLAYAFSGRLDGGSQKSNVKSQKEMLKAAEPEVKYKNNGLPESWKWVKLGEVCGIEMGQSPPSSTYNTDKIGLPFFQGKAEFTEFHPEVRKWCSKPKKIAEPFDILLSVRAPVGSTNIANQKCCIGRGLAAIRYPNCYKYIFYHLRFIENKLDELGTGSTFKAISSITLRNVKIPLPPLSEQSQIVEEIESRFAGSEALEKAIDDSLTKAETLRQSILKRAFEGKLV